MQALHPNSCMLFRLTEGAHSLVYMLDYELGQADETVRKELEAFIYKADHMIFDAQYTREELSDHAGWGHSCWEQGLELGECAGIGQIMLTHYDRSHTDDFLRELEKQASKRSSCSIFMREKNVYPLW